MFIQQLFEGSAKRIIVTYPGRFQPFHKGHAEVFANLQRQFGNENVFIVTSNKTDAAKSPFNFSDKVRFMHAMGIQNHNIIETDKVYDLPGRFEPVRDQVVFITVVGAPDARRLNPGATKKDGNPSYFQNVPQNKNEFQTADKHGYVIIEPEHPESITIGGKQYDVSHGTPTRELWNQIRNNPQQRAEFVTQLYGRPDGDLANTLDKIPTGAAPAPAPAAKMKNVKKDLSPVQHDPNAVAESNGYEQGFADPNAPQLGAQAKAGFKRAELQHELGHEQNNLAISINGKVWKVIPGKGYADSFEERQYLKGMQSWAAKKSASSGKKWTVGLTGAPVTVDESFFGKAKSLGPWFLKKDGDVLRTVNGEPFTFKSKEEAVQWAMKTYKISYKQQNIIPTTNPDKNLMTPSGAVVAEGKLNEFAPDEGGGSRKFIPWPEFIEQVKQIVAKDFDCVENVVKTTIKARFVPHDPMEFGPTMLYSYYETRAGRKGAHSTRGAIQIGKYTGGGFTGQIKGKLLTTFSLLKGHPFERHFDLTFDNIYKIANIIMGNTQGALEFNPQQQGVAEGWTKLPSGDYQNSHTGVRSSKPPVKKKRGEKTGAEWDAIEKAKKDKEQGVAEDDAGDVEQRMLIKIEKEKQRLAKLKQTDPEAYKREMEKRKTSSRIPPVSTFEQQGVAEGADERKQNALWAQITAHEKAAKKSKDLKQQHHLKMADQLRSQLKTNDSVAEGDVVQFPKKHKGDISDMHSCPKCGGDTQGGTYMGHKVQVCMPCKQVYLPPNSGIDQQGNKINEYAVDDSGDSGEEDTLHKYARMWYQGDLATQQQVEQILDRMGWEIGELESEEGGCFVVRSGDKNGNSYIGFAPADLTEEKQRLDPSCWKGYRKAGTKMKGNTRVNNCVPVSESAENLNVGDPVIITGDVHFRGKTGDIDSFGEGNRFVVVNLYNHGKHSFHSSDVSYNDHDHEDDLDEDLYQYDKEDPYNSEFAPRAGMGRMSLRGWKQQMIKRTAELAQQMAAAGQDIDKSALWDNVYAKLKSMNMDPIAQEIEQAQAELARIRSQGGVRSRAFGK